MGFVSNCKKKSFLR